MPKNVVRTGISAIIGGVAGAIWNQIVQPIFPILLAEPRAVILALRIKSWPDTLNYLSTVVVWKFAIFSLCILILSLLLQRLKVKNYLYAFLISGGICICAWILNIVGTETDRSIHSVVLVASKVAPELIVCSLVSFVTYHLMKPKPQD